jgi:HEAT repeat protein
MARANNEESLNYLRAIADSAPLTMLGDRAVLSISLHDDVRVAQMLKNFSRNSPNQRIRSSSIYWLGQIGGEQAFLADIVRNENEDKRLRRTAAYAIGESRDQDALTTLQNLYDTVKDADVHRGIIQGIGNNQNQDAAIAFLLRVAKSDPERDARRTATRRLGEFDRDTADELMKIYSSDPDPDVRRSALQSLGQSKNAKAFARLLEVARSDAPNEMRRQAIRSLTQRGEAAAEDLIKLFDSESQLDVRRAILQSLSEIKGSRAEDKLFQVAREEENPTLRSQAIRMLGERAGKRSLDFLTATIENVDANTEVQLQAVRSLAQRPADEAVPLLIKLAKTHPNQSIRKQAIRSLAQSGDPRAVELFRELLSR